MRNSAAGQQTFPETWIRDSTVRYGGNVCGRYYNTIFQIDKFCFISHWANSIVIFIMLHHVKDITPGSFNNIISSNQDLLFE